MIDTRCKVEMLKMVSDPDQVKRNFKKHYGGGTVYISGRKYKKYMVIDPVTHKSIHFGDMRFEDFTKNKSITRRKLFQIRNHKWATAEKYTPQHLSYYILW